MALNLPSKRVSCRQLGNAEPKKQETLMYMNSEPLAMQQEPQVESLANNQLKHNGLPDRMFAVHTWFLFLLFFICAYLMFFLSDSRHL